MMFGHKPEDICIIAVMLGHRPYIYMGIRRNCRNIFATGQLTNGIIAAILATGRRNSLIAILLGSVGNWHLLVCIYGSGIFCPN